MSKEINNLEFLGKVKGLMTFKEQEQARLPGNISINLLLTANGSWILKIPNAFEMLSGHSTRSSSFRQLTKTPFPQEVVSAINTSYR